jgi:TPR repeat protein
MTRNHQEAIKWFRTAAEQGHAKARYYLGLSYANGQGVTQDHQEAAKWFRLAAGQGDAAAQNTLGLSYKLGQGVAQDTARAYMWLKLAVVNHHHDAQANLDEVAQRLTPDQIAAAIKRARECKKSNYTACD